MSKSKSFLDDVILLIAVEKAVIMILYGLEASEPACLINIRLLRLTYSVVSRFFMKLYNTNNIETVKAFPDVFLVFSYLVFSCLNLKLSSMEVLHAQRSRNVLDL